MASDDAARAVKRALSDESPQTIEEAVREEIVALWTDLDRAMKEAIDGNWSMQCDWLTERIAILTYLTAPVSLDAIPETFPAGVYLRIAQAIQETQQ